MIKELDVVVLQRDLPQQRLQAGDVGTIVAVYETGQAFEVEFSTLTGRTVSVVTLQADAIRLVAPTDMTHVRAAVA